MNTKKQGRPPIHEASFKIAIAREYLLSSLGYGALAVKYGLPVEAIRFFVKWYRKNYPDPEPALPSAGIPSVKEPAVNVNNTDQQLQEANLKIAGLEMLIENVQKELGIDIRKKLGTKQLNK